MKKTLLVGLVLLALALAVSFCSEQSPRKMVGS